MPRITIAHYDENGSTEAIQAASACQPLFTVQPGEEDKFEANLLYGLKKWVSSNTNLYKLPDDIRLDMLSIELSSIPTYVNERVSICRFEQTYRGMPVYGRSRYITLTVIDRKDVRKISGKIIDEQQPYRGLENSISTAEAATSIRKHWMQSFPDVDVLIRDVRKVAIPEKTMIGFFGEIGERIFTSSRRIRGSVIVDAETGNLVLLSDFKAEASVRGLEMKGNPHTETQVVYDNIPATQFGNTIHLAETHPLADCDPPTWLDFRMGNETRFTILDLNDTNAMDIGEINQFTVGGCSSGTPPPPFLTFLTSDLFPDAVPFRFMAQDLVVKTTRVLDAIDPLMGELITHGASHSYSWNHPPDVPKIAHRSPLVILLNASESYCKGVNGCFDAMWFSEDVTKLLGLPVPHPLVYVCRNANDEIVSCSDPDVACKEQYGGTVFIDSSPIPNHTYLLFHELGHYYDNFNAHGFLIEDLREIVPQLFGLYLHRKLYPDLTYTLSTLPEEGHCDLSALVAHNAGLVVHPDCISDLSAIAQSIVLTSNGYSIKAFTQAYWSLLFGVTCSLENNSVVCDQPNSLPANYEDRWMEALLFALQMGNEQSFVELWENMELFIEANYPDDLDLIQLVRAFHGLQ